MRKFSVGVVVGLLIGLLAFAAFAVADSPVKLIINGQAIDCRDTPPQIINGRTYVPAKYVAEPLGAKVEWDAKNKAVVITGIIAEQITETKQTSLPNNPPADAIMPNSRHAIKQSGNWYINGRWLLEFMTSKYPGQVKGLTATGELQLSNNVIQLEKVVIDNAVFFDAKPLLELGHLTESDFN